MSDYFVDERVLLKTLGGWVQAKELVEEYAEAEAYEHAANAIRRLLARAEKAERRADFFRAQLVERMNHGQTCRDDRFARDVCEGTYIDKCDAVLGLVEGLRAVLALAGEDKQIREIIEKTMAEHGGCDA